jgi:hypothetical protein
VEASTSAKLMGLQGLLELQLSIALQRKIYIILSAIGRMPGGSVTRIMNNTYKKTVLENENSNT